MPDAVSWHSSIAADFDAGYARSPAFRERLAVWARLIEHYQRPGGTVLDAGCGPGHMTALAAPGAGSVLAFDASPEMMALARERGAAFSNVEYGTGRLGDDGLTGGRRFDLILCSSVLEYIDDLWPVVDWLGSALAPGGTMLFSLPNGESIYRVLEGIAFRITGRPRFYAHVRQVMPADTVRRELALRGFVVRQTEYYAQAALFSRLMRPVGLRRFADNLFVIACSRAP